MKHFARRSRESLATRRNLQSILGWLWLIDSALQLQPRMLTSRFSAEVLGENTMGPPNVLTNLIHSIALHISAHPTAWDIFFVVVQALLGIPLISHRFDTVALAGSTTWGIMVWIVGEGLGGILVPQASILTGAPGSALLYAAISLVLLPSPNASVEPSTNSPGGSSPSPPAASTPADSGLLGQMGSLVMWALVWIGTSLLELESANHAPNAISAQISANASGEPWLIAKLDHLAASATLGKGTPIAFAILLLGCLTGTWALRRSTLRPALALGIILAIIYWVLGQNFGAVFTGGSTDPNTGPAFVLLALCLWPQNTKPSKHARRLVGRFRKGSTLRHAAEIRENYLQGLAQHSKNSGSCNFGSPARLLAMVSKPCSLANPPLRPDPSLGS